MHRDPALLKEALIESFSDVEHSGAMNALWDFCRSRLKSLRYIYHSRRTTDKCPVNYTVSDNLLSTVEKLDSVDSIPPIHCEACDLHQLHSLHLGDAS